VRSTSTRLGRNPKAAAVVAVALVAAVVVAVPAVVAAVVDVVRAASPAGNAAPKQEVRRPALRIGRRA
jgi:hypothetical protein